MLTSGKTGRWEGAACIHPAAPCLSSLMKGETAIASQPFVSKASPDGMEVTATAIACGQEFLHEFGVSVSSRAPVGRAMLDEGTVLAFISVLIRAEENVQPAWTIVPSQTWRVNGGHWAFVPVYSQRHCL